MAPEMDLEVRIVYDAQKAAQLELSSDKQLVAIVREDLDALKIVHPRAESIRWNYPQSVYFSWATWKGSPIYRLLHSRVDHAAASVKAERSIENIFIFERPPKSSSSRTPSNKPHQHPTLPYPPRRPTLNGNGRRSLSPVSTTPDTKSQAFPSPISPRRRSPAPRRHGSVESTHSTSTRISRRQSHESLSSMPRRSDSTASSMSTTLPPRPSPHFFASPSHLPPSVPSIVPNIPDSTLSQVPTEPIPIPIPKQMPPPLGPAAITTTAAEKKNMLMRELWDTRRKITASQARETAILNELNLLGALHIPSNEAEPPGINDSNILKARLQMADLELRNEKLKREKVEQSLKDIERECRDPFVVPALLQAFIDISELTTGTVAGVVS